MNTAKKSAEEWYKLYVGPYHPGPALELVGMRLPSVSASSCERNWSAHGHIRSEVRNRIAPATTEKPDHLSTAREGVNYI
jgi:hypothetical protein